MIRSVGSAHAATTDAASRAFDLNSLRDCTENPIYTDTNTNVSNRGMLDKHAMAYAMTIRPKGAIIEKHCGNSIDRLNEIRVAIPNASRGTPVKVRIPSREPSSPDRPADLRATAHQAVAAISTIQTNRASVIGRETAASDA